MSSILIQKEIEVIQFMVRNNILSRSLKSIPKTNAVILSKSVFKSVKAGANFLKSTEMTEKTEKRAISNKKGKNILKKIDLFQWML